jgi:hypothetical protein
MQPWCHTHKYKSMFNMGFTCGHHQTVSDAYKYTHCVGLDSRCIFAPLGTFFFFNDGEHPKVVGHFMYPP